MNFQDNSDFFNQFVRSTANDFFLTVADLTVDSKLDFSLAGDLALLFASFGEHSGSSLITRKSSLVLAADDFLEVLLDGCKSGGKTRLSISMRGTIHILNILQKNNAPSPENP